ncbi:unnamed protein product, partial [Tenebrio molitor]
SFDAFLFSKTNCIFQSTRSNLKFLGKICRYTCSSVLVYNQIKSKWCSTFSGISYEAMTYPKRLKGVGGVFR